MKNKTDSMVYEWLKDNERYVDEEIKISNSPTFICEDGKRYEAKFLYNSTLVFYASKIKNLKPNDIILVCNTEDVIDQFKWKERDKTNYKIHIQKDKDFSGLKIRNSTLEKLRELKTSNKDTYENVILRLIKHTSN